MTAPIEHPRWCVPHECTVVPDLPCADTSHRSQTIVVPTLHMTAQRNPGQMTAWLEQRAPRPDGTTYPVWLYLSGTLTGVIAGLPVDTVEWALNQLADLVSSADEPRRPADPGSLRPVIQLTYPDDLAAEQQAARDRRGLGAIPGQVVSEGWGP